jgi:glycosyltransferase involved in cell wall biosynthesis
MPLKVGAKVDPVDRDYWEHEIAPLFAANDVEYLGELNEQEKAELLSGAYATLFPVDWPEPFGLVMAESLACGTPVIALRRGSVPEVLEHGVSGFICDTLDQLTAAVAQVAQIDRAACRRAAQRFSASAMAAGYEEVYRKLSVTSLLKPLARRTRAASA